MKCEAHLREFIRNSAHRLPSQGKTIQQATTGSVLCGWAGLSFKPKPSTRNKPMSHFTTIQTQIKDLDALRAACSELGFGLLQHVEARGIGTQQRAEHVIRLKGPCDVALHRETNGTFGLSTDWWGGYVEQEVGKNYGRLLQLYAVHKASREARKRGLSVQRALRTDGSIKLTIGGL